MPLTSQHKIRLTYISSINVRWHHLELLCRHLDRNRFDVSFLLLSLAEGRPHIESVLQDEGIPYETVDCKVSPAGIWKALRKVVSHCRRRRVEIVHTHIFFASLVGLLGAFLARVPVRINTRHHATMNHGTSFRWLDRMNNRLATCTVATCKLLESVLVDLENVPSRKVERVRLGIDVDRFRQVPRERVEAVQRKYLPNRASPVVGVIARHIEQKGVQHVIPAFRRLLETEPEPFLVLAYATGPYRETLEGLLETIPPERYALIEFEEDVPALYKAFDVLVHVPTGPDQESFGLIFLEGLAAGVPSVFTLSGVGPELLRHRENAWLVDYGDVDEIHRGIQRLLDDPQLAQALVDEGYRTVDPDFRAETMVRALEDLYERQYRSAR